MRECSNEIRDVDFQQAWGETSDGAGYPSAVAYRGGRLEDIQNLRYVIRARMTRVVYPFPPERALIERAAGTLSARPTAPRPVPRRFLRRGSVL